MILSLGTTHQWKKYVPLCHASSVYQDPRWLELIESVYPKIKILRLICKNQKGQLLWLLPLCGMRPMGKIKQMWISLLFGNYGGFLLPKDNPFPLDEKKLYPLREFFSHSSAFALEIREIDPPSHNLRIETQFQRFELVFPKTKDMLWQKGITGNARTCVRKADKLGVGAIFEHEHAVNIFQMLYEKNASYHGTPIHHISWYKCLTELFQEETEIVLAKYQDVFIAALLILHYQGKSILHAAVTDPQYKKIPATDKLLWASFERILERGTSQSFDFGRTRPDPGKHFLKKNGEQ